MTPPSASPSAQVIQTPRPWWRFGMVWMVLGGPAAVVVASVFTYYLAVRSPDPVLATEPEASSMAGDLSQAPAVQGRNHAATGELPAGATKTQASAPR